MWGCLEPFARFAPFSFFTPFCFFAPFPVPCASGGTRHGEAAGRQRRGSGEAAERQRRGSGEALNGLDIERMRKGTGSEGRRQSEWI